MGWRNPAVPWSELERRLSDAHADDPLARRPGEAAPPPGDGGDSPAWSRRRGPYVAPPGLPTRPSEETGDARRPGVERGAQRSGGTPGTTGSAPTSEGRGDPTGPRRRARAATPWAELHAHSSFSFLDGASHPEELAEEAARLGLEAMALTDHDGLYGVVRFAEAARALGVPTVFGSEVTLGRRTPQLGVADPGVAEPGTPSAPRRTVPKGGRIVVAGLEPDRSGDPGDLDRHRFGVPDLSRDLAGVDAGDGPHRLGPDPEHVGPAPFPPATPRPADVGGVVGGETHLVVLARDPHGYGLLARAVSEAQLRGEKGAPDATLADLAAVGGTSAPSADRGRWLVLTGCRKGAVPRALVERGPAAARTELDRLVEAFGREHVAVELWDHGDPLDAARNDALATLALSAGVELVVTGNTHYATPARRPLATALAAVRARRSLDEMDGWLPAGAGAHLRSGVEQARRFARYPGVVERTAELGAACAFDLRLVAPSLPPFPCPDGLDEMAFLRRLVEEGGTRRYGPRHAERVPGAWAQIDHELAVIDQLGFAGYFLVVWDIVEFCRRSDIYCQGRGSAANSAACFALGVTKADAVRLGLLFERFLSPERDGPPDIDLDIESGRREEVIQYVYERHGRRHAAQVANVITYRARSAVRDMAKALGYAPGQQDAWAKQLDRWSPLSGTVEVDGPASVGLAAPSAPVGRVEVPSGAAMAASDGTSTVGSGGTVGTGGSVGAGGSAAPMSVEVAPEPGGPNRQLVEDGVPPLVVELARQVEHFPRHLGIHSGGMVICDRPVIEVCPVEWARMEGRSVLQWDKDDCAAAGLVKFDLLGLGMLSALHLAVDLVDEAHGVSVDLAEIPQEDAVYDMLCRADSIGVFQVESRAQMATLPRLRPRTFYDLVVEVALIRPGPIQGGSVHPYIRRRNGKEPVTYLHPLLEPSLSKTLGIPLFQEQLMQMAIDVAGFSASEADQLRQAMGSKRSTERMERLRARLYEGMAARGITGEVADRIWDKLAAFANFGFPESHSVSFAYLVYASSWLKLHYPAAFCAALLNAQPMGFYSPHSLVQDARRHGVEVRTPDLNASGVGATLEWPTQGAAARDVARAAAGLVDETFDGVVEESAAEPACAPRRDEARHRHPSSAAALDGHPDRDVDEQAARWIAAHDGGDLATARAGHRPGARDRGTPTGAGPEGSPVDPADRAAAVNGGHRPGPQPVVRLGLSSVRNLGDDVAERIVADREARGPFRSMEDLQRRVPMGSAALEALATAGAFGSFTDAEGRPLDRRRALWAAGAVAGSGPDRLAGVVTGVEAPTLPGMGERDEALADLWATGVAPDGHPTRFVREALDARGVRTAAELRDLADGSRVWVAGVVTHRQRPATAGGTTFVNLEDETGLINVVCSKGCWTHHRRVLRSAPALLVRGRLESAEGVVNVIAERIEALPLAAGTGAPHGLASRDFR